MRALPDVSTSPKFVRNVAGRAAMMVASDASSSEPMLRLWPTFRLELTASVGLVAFG